MAVGFVYVVDADGVEVDRVEYDVADYSPAVVTVAEALGKTLKEAHALVAAQNPGAERTSEQRAREYAEILAGDGEGLRVSDSPPPPVPAASVAKITSSEG